MGGSCGVGQGDEGAGLEVVVPFEAGRLCGHVEFPVVGKAEGFDLEVKQEPVRAVVREVVGDDLEEGLGRRGGSGFLPGIVGSASGSCDPM